MRGWVGCTGGSWTALHLSAPVCHPRQARTARIKAVSGLGESSQRSSPVARKARCERTSILSALMMTRGDEMQSKVAILVYEDADVTAFSGQFDMIAFSTVYGKAA